MMMGLYSGYSFVDMCSHFRIQNIIVELMSYFVILTSTKLKQKVRDIQDEDTLFIVINVYAM